MCKFFRISMLVGLAVGMFSCAHAADALRSLAGAGKFQEAAAAAVGDEEGTRALAASVLEAAAVNPVFQYFAVERLSVSGGAGHLSLENLARRQDAPGRAARIALRRFDKPRGEETAACLADEDADVRRLCLLAWAREMSEDALRKALLDTDPTVRLFALGGLEALPLDAARAPLFMDVVLRDPSPTLRTAAARRGDLLGAEGLLLLKDLLSDPRIGMRIAAVEGLAASSTAPARTLLRSLAGGPLDEIALTAAAACAGLGDPFCTSRLVAALSDERPSIRTAALYQLRAEHIENARDLTVKCLSDKAPEVVLAAANLLKSDAPARAEVLRVLRDIEKTRNHAAQGALYLMARIGDMGAVTRVQLMLKPVAEMKESEVISLLRSVQGTAELVDAVVPLLGDTREAVRVQAAVFVLFSMSKK